MRLLIALAALIVATGPANAGLSVCNKSVYSLIVALSHFNGTQWRSEGWRHLAPGKCSELIFGPLNARYYYLFATDGAFNNWAGNKNFCVSPAETFSVVGRADCKGRGLLSRGFIEVDTGEQKNWTYTFSDFNQ